MLQLLGPQLLGLGLLFLLPFGMYPVFESYRDANNC